MPRSAKRRPTARPAPAARLLSRTLDLVAALAATPSGREQLRAYWTYALYTSQLRPQGLRRLLRRRLGNQVETTMISTGERMERRARRQGRAEGLDQGQALLLLRLFRKRFGPLPAALVRRVQHGNRRSLQRWAERLLTAPTLAKVFDRR